MNFNVYDNLNGHHSSGIYECLDNKNENQYYNVTTSTNDSGTERFAKKKK
jgi:hypothetical protein